MNRQARVFLRNGNITKTVDITGPEKPDISNDVLRKWQNIIDLIAKILDVPSGLIMKITEDSMEVFAKSSNRENPYEVGGCDTLGHGLYCETVIGKNSELHIDNALKYEEWSHNPDVRLDMISYYGLPLQWPDKTFFGTICVLDRKVHVYNDDFKRLIGEFKLSIEKDLDLLCQKQELKFYAERDCLTSVFNRRKIESVISNEFSRSKRNANPFSIAIFDLNRFKDINDKKGHDVGDRVLTAFASGLAKRIRTVDAFGRWGGDEFLLVCPDTPKKGIRVLLSNIENDVKAEMDQVTGNSGFCSGIAEFSGADEDYRTILKRADEDLYRCKQKN